MGRDVRARRFADRRRASYEEECETGIRVAGAHGLEEAIGIAMHCAGAFRIPVPTRMAHLKTGEYRDRMLGCMP
jgi:hypothetical protein